VLDRHRAESQARDLWKDEPHPMALFAPGPQLLPRTVISAALVLRNNEPFEPVRIVHRFVPRFCLVTKCSGVSPFGPAAFRLDGRPDWPGCRRGGVSRRRGMWWTRRYGRWAVCDQTCYHAALVRGTVAFTTPVGPRRAAVRDRQVQASVVCGVSMAGR